jgi:hypothetical protein
VNDTTLYITHNLGANGGLSLLKSPPGGDARAIVGEEAARNNPMFFKGRPTVATVLQRYADAMNATAQADNEPGPKTPKPSAGGAMADNGLLDRLKNVITGKHPGETDQQTFERGREENSRGIRAVADTATDFAPAIGSTIGAVGGGAMAGPVGAVGGGAAGGAAGQALKDYIKGNDQNPREILKQGALGGVLGVGSAARPVLAVAGRVAGSAAVEAGAEAAGGAEGPDVADAALRGGAEAIGGEAFGRALGMAGHKVYSLFAPEARAGVHAAAKDYTEASKVLETQQPKITGPNGAVANPEYVAAEVKRTKAENKLKDAGLNPEEAAYAHRVSSEGVPKREAEVTRPGELEKKQVGQGYQQLEHEVGDKGVGNVKPTPKLTDGPIATATDSKMSPALQRTAERTEMAITAPAKDWQEKWVQLKDARSALLDLERDALSSTTAGRTQTAKDYRALADAVRTQQEKAASHVFGPKLGGEFMQRLKVLDTRYARLMEATNGGDLVKAAGMQGEAGREANRRFRAFAANDPAALSAWESLRKAKGGDPEKTIPWTVVLEGIPVIKHFKIGVLAGMLRDHAREITAGQPAKFADIVKSTPDTTARTVRDIAGSAGARAAVQGDVLNGVGQ